MLKKISTDPHREKKENKKKVSFHLTSEKQAANPEISRQKKIHVVRTNIHANLKKHDERTSRNTKKRNLRRTRNKRELKKKMTLNILYMNADGVNNKLESIEAAAQATDTHIIAVTETKLKSKPNKINGYQWKFKPRKNRDGGGVAIAIREDIWKQTREVKLLEDQNQEILWIELNMKNKRKVFIGTYYGKQESQTKEVIEREFSQILTQIISLKSQGDIILTGDFNSKLEVNKDTVKQEQSRNGRIFNEMIKESNLYVASLHATKGNWTRTDRIDRQKKSILDYILISQALKDKTQHLIIDEEGHFKARSKSKKYSDHNTMAISIELEHEETKTFRTKFQFDDMQAWKQVNEEVYKNLKTSEDSEYQKFNQVITDAIKNNIKTKKIQNDKFKPISNPHIKELRNVKRNQRKLFEQAPNNSEIKKRHLEEYLSTQKDLKDEIEKQEMENTKAKAEELIQKGGVKSNDFWKITKRIKNPKKEEYDLLTEDGKTLVNPEESKKYIANYYQDLYKIREPDPEYNGWTNYIVETNKLHEEQAAKAPPMKEFTMKELNEVIKTLKKKKATGPDNIPNEFLINADHNVKQHILKTFNSVTMNEDIPDQWKTGTLTRIYKGKGDKGKCSNERGITLASNIGKTYERLVNNRIQQDLYISEAQAGGRKGKATVDHILAVNELVKSSKKKKKTVYIAFLDVTKAFDKAWLEALLHVISNRGIVDKMWNLVKKLNTGLKVSVQTKYGSTNEIPIQGSIRQGGVTSGTLFATQMDDIAIEIDLMYYGIEIEDEIEEEEDTIGALIWMDDVIFLSEDPEELQKMLDIADKVAKKYHMEYGPDKSKVMVVGKTNNLPQFHLGKMDLEYTDKYKYLGKLLNNKWNLSDHIKETKGKVEAAYQTILHIAHDRKFRNMELDVIWKLYDTCITPLISYAAATWDATEAELKEIDKIQESVIQRILMIPYTTPREAIYAETGLLDSGHIEMREKINQLKRMEINPTKILTNTTKDWVTKTTELMQSLEININEEKSKKMQKDEIKTKILKNKERIMKHLASDKSKFKHLTQDNEQYPMDRKEYIKKLRRDEASTIFKSRARMLQVKSNYKRGSQTLTCRACKEQEETQRHILTECKTIHVDDSTKIRYEDIYEEKDMTILRITSRKINNTMKILSEIE